MVPILTALSLSACKSRAKPASEVKSVACIGTWLGTFVGSIPLPGFSVLGGVAKATAEAVAGTLKSVGSDSLKGTCGSASQFSNEQMQQMKQAISDGFSEQNHMEAVALMNKIETKFEEFVPDQDRFTPYTVSSLQSVVDDANDWWSKYDQSGSRIYNVQDFVIVTGYIMKAYQHMIREVALEASQTRSAGDAQKVRIYAENLARKADHVHKELEEISNNDISEVAKTFWKSAGTSQTKTYYGREMENAHCYESKNGRPYVVGLDESTNKRVPRFLSGLGATKTLGELSSFASANGTICCMDSSGCKDQYAVEPVIQKYLDEATKQVKQVMFYNNADLMKYYNEVLPLFITAAQRIKEAPDDAIFALAVGTAQAKNTVTSSRSSGGSCDYSNAAASNGWGYNNTTKESCPPQSSSSGPIPCPDGDNGPGKGYGTIYQCSDKQCAKTDTSFAAECTVR